MPGDAGKKAPKLGANLCIRVRVECLRDWGSISFVQRVSPNLAQLGRRRHPTGTAAIEG